MFFAIVLFAIFASVLARGRELAIPIVPRLRALAAHPFALPLAVLVMLAAEHAYLALVLDASYHQHPGLAFLRRMPVRIVSGIGGPKHIADSYGISFMALAMLESACLATIYLALERPKRWQIALVCVAALAACADAVSARAGTSADMYSYVGFSLLGKLAYTPPSVPFSGEYSVIDAWWGTPIVPAPYGPFWLALAGGVASLGGTLFAKIVALRIFGAIALLGVAIALVALRMPARVVALVALDPGLVFEFVGNVHNDLFAVALLLFARLAASRRAFALAIGLAVLAALVKLPFLIFAALVFAPIPNVRTRVVFFSLTALLALAISWVWGGHAYLAALTHHVNENSSNNAIVVLANPIAIFKVVALVAVALAFFKNRWYEGYAWTLPTIGATFLPWYLSWALPYAIERQTMVRNFAIALPMVVIETDHTLGNGALVTAVEIAFYAFLVVACARMVLARRRSATGTAVAGGHRTRGV